MPQKLQYLEHLKSLLHLLRHYVCIGLFMCVDIFEQLLGMCLCLDFFAGENSTYYALFIDKKCCAYGADSGFAIHFFLAPCSETLQKSGAGVGYEGERK